VIRNRGTLGWTLKRGKRERKKGHRKEKESEGGVGVCDFLFFFKICKVKPYTTHFSTNYKSGHTSSIVMSENH